MQAMSSPLILALWISQPVIQALLALVIIRRKLHRSFSAFLVYNIAQIVMFAIQFPIHRWGSTRLYYDVYWLAAALNVLLEFRIIHEIFVDIFRPYPALKDLGTALFKWAAVVMVLVSVVMVSVNPDWNDSVTLTIIVVQRCIRIVQCGLVVFLLAFCKHLKVSWRRQSFGIALGFGVFAATELLTYALFSGWRVHGTMANVTSLAGYNLGMLTWLGYSLFDQKATTLPVLVPQRWDEALLDLQPQSESESLIPMFEHMVDRALAKAPEA